MVGEVLADARQVVERLDADALQTRQLRRCRTSSGLRASSRLRQQRRSASHE